MKPTACLLLLACSLASCSFHVHVHEAAPAGPAASAALASSTPSSRPGTIEGVVVDERGQPLAGRVALVTTSGCRIVGVDGSGVFEFHDLRGGDHVVTATTADGRIAVQPGVRPGEAFRLPPVRPGARLTVSLEGLPSSRLAVLQGTTRVHDFTLRAGAPAELVVPAGELVLRAYTEGADQVRSLSLATGETRTLAFHLDS